MKKKNSIKKNVIYLKYTSVTAVVSSSKPGNSVVLLGWRSSPYIHLLSMAAVDIAYTSG